ncbi:Multitransmembrane protein [Handroanthus impetiginosus]|uniref:Sugar transporter SWEET1 n=1 Tax=Handroanthus impetiginosus TaxID=429701 RepID=A0A2G9I803_9LAMI|nr:Multitransmembrane protein [Handroanthus impetiginosus]
MAGFSGHWAFAFGLLGNIISFMVYLASIPNFYQICKKKSSEGFQAIPHVVALLNAMLWIYYALLKCNATLIIPINSVGCVIETIYISFFIFYATKKFRVQTLKLLVLPIVCGMGFIYRCDTFPNEGFSTCNHCLMDLPNIFFVCVHCPAPLCIVRQVIRTKSVGHMPFLPSLFLTLKAVMWFFYGLLLKDFKIVIPNTLGFSFGVIQMVLYVMYKNTKNTPGQQKLPEIQKQTTILEEQKIPEATEQIFELIPNVLGFSFGVVQMVLYLMYKNAKNTPDQQHPISEEQKIPEVTGQIIEIVKLGALLISDKKLAKALSNDKGVQVPNLPKGCEVISGHFRNFGASSTLHVVF